MNIGWIGLGKLGLPCALTLAQHHTVTGYDVSDRPWQILSGELDPPAEEDIELLLGRHKLEAAHTVADVVEASEVVFVAVQTPHAPKFGGEVPMPDERRDFDYTALTQAVRDVCRAAQHQRKHITLAVVSTVLPGTCSRLIRPLLPAYVRFAYTPAFIAMGTTIADYQAPEFQLAGASERDAGHVRAHLTRVFDPVHGGNRLLGCTVEEAETIKVFYNCAISAKIVLANTIMETCHHTGANADVVVSALARATDRIISAKYLRGGMGDGGACHPRDLIAMSWMARRLDLSYDYMGALINARELQTAFIADLAQQQSELTGLPLVVCGRSYKPGSAITAGSPALLLGYLLGRWNVDFDSFDPHCGTFPPQDRMARPAVFLIATAHPEFYDMSYPAGSVVIDPHGKMADRPGLTVIRVGR